MADQDKKEAVRDFSKVILTLDNVLIPDDKLFPTPSMADGLESEVETDLRILGCELIQTSGILLKMPQVAMATGQVLFQRFYYSKSFVKHNMETVAMACINVASKIEESPRRIRDVINVFHHIKQVKNGKLINPLVLDQNYISHKNQVIKAERRILKELGFCVHVKHPHKIIVMYLQVLENEKNQRLAQSAWNYMNDSFRTNVFVRYQPESIACACIYLAARKLQIALPASPPWFVLFGVQEQDLQDISVSILELYTRQKPNIDSIEKAVNACKKIHIEAKLKARGMSGSFTPNSSSRPATPSKVSPSPLSAPVMKKLKAEGDQSDHSSFGSRLDNHVSRKKRSHSRSRSPASRSRSRSHSKSRSYSSRGSGSPPTPRHSQSPPINKYSKKESRDKKYYSIKEKDYRENYDRDYHHRDQARERQREREHVSSGKHKRRRHTPTYSPARSYSISPEPRSKNHKKYYKEKESYRSTSRSRDMDHDRHRPSKKRNGHHRTGSRDHYRR